MITAPTSMPQVLVASPESCKISCEMSIKDALSRGKLYYDILVKENPCHRKQVFLRVKDCYQIPVAEINVRPFRKPEDTSVRAIINRMIQQIESGEIFRSI